MGSYPTYEEWKLFNDKSLAAFNNSSYPTYEEWKPPYQLNTICPFPLFLSYL